MLKLDKKCPWIKGFICYITNHHWEQMLDFDKPVDSHNDRFFTYKKCVICDKIELPYHYKHRYEPFRSIPR